MHSQIQIVSILGSAALLLLVLELVRRRRLLERYALLWLFSAIVLLGVSVWRSALSRIADLLGIAYAPNALFFIFLAFILLLLLNFSLAVSRLTDQTKVLAQRLAILEERASEHEEAVPSGEQRFERALPR